MKKEINHSLIIARAVNARQELYFGSFITESENMKVHSRIVSYQDKHKVDGRDIDKYIKRIK